VVIAGVSVSGGFTVSLAPARCRDLSLDPSLDGLQWLPIISERGIDSEQQGFQATLTKQVTFDLENQALELGTIGGHHRTEMISGDFEFAVQK
jgi:hypothetical protein